MLMSMLKPVTRLHLATTSPQSVDKNRVAFAVSPILHTVKKLAGETERNPSTTFANQRVTRVTGTAVPKDHLCSPVETPRHQRGGMMGKGDRPKADFSDVESGSSSTAPTPAGRSYTVQKGDSLSKIAKREYGDAQQWRKIYEANRDLIPNPDLIYPGQVFRIPEA
jgi:nucleoid-associated protein YgaU